MNLIDLGMGILGVGLNDVTQGIYQKRFGSVGIGAPVPKQKLEIAGQIQAGTGICFSNHSNRHAQPWNGCFVQQLY